jgi:hypothetical protein
MVVTADLAPLLDREYEGTPLEELVNAPVSALAGISKADEEYLKQASRITTVGDLGRNKFFRAATAMVDLTGAKSGPGQAKGR